MLLSIAAQGISTDPFVDPLASMDEAEHFAAVRTPASLMKITRSQFMVVPEKQRRTDRRAAGPKGSSSGLYVSSSNPKSETPDEITIVTKGNDDETMRIPFAEFMKVSLGRGVIDGSFPALVLPSKETLTLLSYCPTQSIDDDEDSSDSWGRVADAVAEMQDRLSGESEVPHIDREELAQGIRNAIEELVENGAVDERLDVEVEVPGEKTEPAEQYITKPAT